MNRTTSTLSVAAMCIVALAGCATRDGYDTAGGYGSSGSSGSGGSGDYGYGSTGRSGVTGETMAPSSAGASAGTVSGGGVSPSSAPGAAMMSAQTSYGVVQAVDQMQRQDVGVGALGAAAAGGGTGMPTDKVYRVTVRFEDGSSQMVVLDSMPSYKAGDKVRYSNGMLQSY